MHTEKYAGAFVSIAGALLLLGASNAAADIASDRAAAILLFPKVVFQEWGLVGTGGSSFFFLTDTTIQITNTSNQPVELKCFYVNANSHCSISEYVCDPSNPTPCPDSRDLCLPGWVETDFRVNLTPQQPVAWSAIEGLRGDNVPLDGVFAKGPNGASNAGTGVPPVSAEGAFFGPDVFGGSFTGELKCVVVNAQGQAVASNVVKGEATIQTATPLLFMIEDDDLRTLPDVTAGGGKHIQGSLRLSGSAAAGANPVAAAETAAIDFVVPTVEKYNAVGIQAIEGDANNDKVLELGGGSNEYNGCANVLIVDHFFDFAFNPLSETAVTSDLTLVPCAQDLRRQIPGSTGVQYLVFNEFEQRFSTSAPVDCFFERTLSSIDTRNPERSIFSVFVAGTLSGQTRIRGVDGGLVALLRERYIRPTPIVTQSVSDPVFRYARNAAVNVHLQGERATADRIVLP